MKKVENVVVINASRPSMLLDDPMHTTFDDLLIITTTTPYNSTSSN
jgi:hypothetical protein